MKTSGTGEPVTAVISPASALRGSQSIGEFADLPVLGRWVAFTDFSLIQIHPVNDIGIERWP